MASSIHQELVLDASPERVYRALTDGLQFSKMTGDSPASIGAVPGEEFSCFGGMIEGRNIELVAPHRVVQAWRVKTWAAGEYSIVRIELAPVGPGTRLVLDHKGFPADQTGHLDEGWRTNYWHPLQAFLAR